MAGPFMRVSHLSRGSGGAGQHPWGPTACWSHAEGRCPTGCSPCFQFLITNHKTQLLARSFEEQGRKGAPLAWVGPAARAAPVPSQD